MPALKPKRNYPMMDMTAMCDVAFLLLTFFILTAQFKAQDAATIETPSSISAIKVPDKDIMIISIGKDGKVYFGVDNQQTRLAMLENITQTEGVQFTDKQKKMFSLQANFGVPIRGLSQWLQAGVTNPDKMKEIVQPGIPTDSTAQNELAKWIYQARRANNLLRIAIKGDNVAKFPVFKDVMASLQAQNINKFNLITGTEAPPAGWSSDKQHRTLFHYQHFTEMADIAQGGGGGHGDKKVRSKKASTRVDMTPMVDLGFLLITFFILATTLSKPSSMSLAVPDKQTEKQETEPLKASKVLTLFLGKDNTVWALDRIAADDDKAKTDLKKVSYGPDLRTFIFQSQGQVDREHGKDDKGLSQFVVVIKPLKSSTYKNMVDVLDEMAVTKSKRYALVDALTTSEKELLGDKANQSYFILKITKRNG